LDPVGSGQGPVAGCCEYGGEPSGSGATKLVTYLEFGLYSVELVSTQYMLSARCFAVVGDQSDSDDPLYGRSRKEVSPRVDP
jgi:hypothetical protein